MIVNELRIGNIIALCYDPDKYGVVLAIEKGGAVHLSCNENPDDIRDVIGIQITSKLLRKFGHSTSIYIKGSEIILTFTGNYITVTINETNKYHIRFLHELQNIVFVNTGQEVIESSDLIW